MSLQAKSVWYFTISIPAIIGAIQQQKRLKAQYIEEQRRQLEQEALEEERRQQEHGDFSYGINVPVTFCLLATRTKKKPRVQEYTEFADVEAVSYTEVIKHSDENDTQKERRNVSDVRPVVYKVHYKRPGWCYVDRCRSSVSGQSCNEVPSWHPESLGENSRVYGSNGSRGDVTVYNNTSVTLASR